MYFLVQILYKLNTTQITNVQYIETFYFQVIIILYERRNFHNQILLSTNNSPMEIQISLPQFVTYCCLLLQIITTSYFI